MVQKIKAAVDARSDSSFVIKARTDAATPLGLDEAIRRLEMYSEAGADCVFADALSSKADIEKVARTVKKPLSVNMGLGIRARKTTPLIPPKDLEKLGVAQISYPRLLSAASLKGMLNALDVFKSDVVQGNKAVDRPDLSVTFEELNDLMGMKVLDELERRYTGG
jgi:2-methylisocitrate lyase-like PEP mutase family enzyme